MELLVGSSIVAAFIAGLAALFAPCCITVLLPAYFASIFKERRTIFLMTFVFFLGLLVVFLPLGLGAAGLGQVFSRYHDTIFLIGGFMLLGIGLTLLLGLHFSMSFSAHPKMKVKGAGSVFMLGIFSGFATLCCAPVLAGALALSVLPGSVFLGGVYTLAYVLGMVIPLFFLAALLDKTSFTEKFWVFKKEFSYKIAGRQVSITLAEILSGAMFVSMGLLIFYLAQTNQLASHSSVSMNLFLAGITNSITNLTSKVPEQAWAVLFFLIFAFIVFISIRKFVKKDER